MASSEHTGAVEIIGPQAAILRHWVVDAQPLLRAVDRVRRRAPFRHMVTPGGRAMSVAMTNCGAVGWVSDRHGYRYAPTDPQSGRRWPRMPPCLAEAARGAAEAAGFGGFAPDVCLVNCYEPGARLSLHQDRDERDFAAPIVSLSLGLPATFLFGGPRRAVRPARYRLEHGDVVVWGGELRLFFHGVAPLRDGMHETLGARRLNLTFRKAR
jgi:alkylated DNA repair protein (DNA oxidative demethylase)